LYSTRAVLLLGSEAGFEHYGHALIAALCEIPCRTEVEQLHLTVTTDHYVIRAYITVDKTGFVYFNQRRHYGLHHKENLIGRKPSTHLCKIVL
jgi:hypothetical protein